MSDIILLGAGRHAKDVIKNIEDHNESELTRSKRLRILGCVDDVNPAGKRKDILGYPVLSSFDIFSKRAFRSARVICAIGDPVGKKRLVEKARKKGLRFVSLIHPTVSVHRTASIGAGSSIFAFSVISSDCTVGDHVSVNYRCCLSHDVSVGRFSTLAPGVSITGCGTLGEGVFMGVHSCTIQDIGIGDWSVVGAGTPVYKDVAPKAVVAGRPERVLRKREPAERII